MEKCKKNLPPIGGNQSKKDRLISSILDQNLTRSNVSVKQLLVVNFSRHSTDPYGLIWLLKSSDFKLFLIIQVRCYKMATRQLYLWWRWLAGVCMSRRSVKYVAQYEELELLYYTTCCCCSLHNWCRSSEERASSRRRDISLDEREQLFVRETRKNAKIFTFIYFLEQRLWLQKSLTHHWIQKMKLHRLKS